MGAVDAMAKIIADTLGWDWPRNVAEGIPSALDCTADAARALLAAGFGDVAQAKAEALEEFALLLRERYPDDVFKPLSDAEHKSANDALAGRSERTHVTRDRISADMMRRAAAQSDELAAEYRTTTANGGEPDA